ncbi:MAG: tetratricopeptide repeat protein [Candidatus Omnitrophica bacterium]|nr:tetratricopeptide repeat protein [Candidatus Omnitrophota bacterium]
MKTGPDRILREGWLARHRDALIFCAIVLAAFLIRLVYLSQIKASPFFVPTYRGLDDYLYDNWALEIARGDLAGKEVFYGLPLYPYFLGLVYFLFGHDVYTAKVIQFFLGAVTCGLVFIIGRRIFNRAVGVIAGLVMCFYAMAIYFEGFFVSSALSLFLNCLVALVLLSATERPSSLRWLAAGLLTGISSLANSSVLLVIPFIIVWWYSMVCHPERPRPARNHLGVTPQNDNVQYLSKQSRLWHCVALVIGVCLAIAPVTIRNYIVGKDFVPVTAHAGITFYGGNNPLCDGSFHLPPDIGTSVIDSKKSATVIAEQKMGRPLKPSEISRFWIDQGIMFIKTHPGDALRIDFRKAVLFWNAHEIPDILPMFFFRRYAPLLGFPLIPYAVIAPLGLLGMCLVFKSRKRSADILYAFIAAVFLSNIIYFVNSRYQLVAVPFLSLFAARAAFWFYVKAKERSWKNVLTAAAGLLVIMAIANIKLLEFRPSQAYNNLAVILKRQGLIDDAIREYRNAIESDPRYPSPYYNLGILYLEQGKFPDAINNFNEAVRLNPSFGKAYAKLGIAYANTGDPGKARASWQRSLEIDPEQPEVREYLTKY